MGEVKIGFFKRIFNSIFSKTKDSQKVNKSFTKTKLFIIFALCFAIAIIFFSSFNSNKESTEAKRVIEKNSLSAVEYCQTVENRLVNILGQVKGIGKVEVFVMVDASPTIKYLEETKQTNSESNGLTTIETTIVLAKNGTITSPVVQVELMPKITGVLVVAAGAKDVKMKTTLINVISSVLSVNISNVEVLEGRS